MLTILHEDSGLLVVQKPAGLVCHPTKDRTGVETMKTGMRSKKIRGERRMAEINLEMGGKRI